MSKRWITLALMLVLLIPLYASASEQPMGDSVIEPEYPVPEYVTRVLEVAALEVGYTELSDHSTKYGVWSGDPYAEWCAEFVCWCVDQADIRFGTNLLNNVFPKYFSSNTGRDWYLSRGRYIARRGIVPGWGSQWLIGRETVLKQNEYIPQPGDFVFFSSADTGDTTHVALLEYCTRDANGDVFLHVIEGNNTISVNPDAVTRNVYPLDYWMILGYGTVHDLADIALRFGNEGVKVKKLQQALVHVGLLDAQYTTGKFGAITTQCVKDFQRLHDLTQTGIATQETQLLLYRLAGM